MTRTLLLAILLTLGGAHASAQSHTWLFESRGYFDPLTAGVREPQVAALALAWADRFAYQVEPDDPRRVWDIDLGVELPVLGWESRAANADGRVFPGAIGIGLWLPIDFHMIEDFVDNSNPIVNTDYRFGGMLKLQYGLDDARWLGARLFVGHESTHLGDEYSLQGKRAFPATFERINVSWEYLDVGLSYEDFGAALPYVARIGVTSTLPFGDSYYSTDAASATESPIGPVTLSANWLDPWAGIEATWVEAFGSGVAWDIYGSAELRWRSIYDYHKTGDDVAEDRALSTNLVAGVKRGGTGGVFGRASPFVRLYHGVNPHGQFRNQTGYTQLGVGLRLVR